jgi:type II secretory pathway pseudopilin PulG
VTLLEILVSLLVFAIGLLPVFDLIRRSTEVARFSREEVIARYLALELADQVAAMPFSLIPDLGDRPLRNEDDGAVLLQGRAETLLVMTPMPPGFSRFLTIETINPRLKRIRARLAWGTFPAREVVITSLTEWRP